MSQFNFIYAEEHLSHREKAVYIYLRDRANVSGVCWPGIKTIARELGLSPRTVQRALADLERRQLIEKRQRERRFQFSIGAAFSCALQKFLLT